MRPEHLLVLSHVVHYRVGSGLAAYGPYAREIDIWSRIFAKISIAAPLGEGKPPDDALPLARRDIALLPLPRRGGTTLAHKAKLIASLPRQALLIGRAMRRVDAVHTRCPGNVGFLGTLLAPLFVPRRIAKYAGQWPDYPGKPLSYRLQTRLLASRWWNAPVTVYGRAGASSPQVIPFFTSVMTRDQVERALARDIDVPWPRPLRLLFVGRLSRNKRVDTIVRGLALMAQAGLEGRARIIGEGDEGEALRRLARSLGVESRIDFTGALPFEDVQRAYAEADVLVLASHTEGWPKVLPEAMVHGVVCVASRRGHVVELLSEERGVLIEPGDAAGLARALVELASDPGRVRRIRQRARRWAQAHTLEDLQEALQDLLAGWWDGRG